MMYKKNNIILLKGNRIVEKYDFDTIKYRDSKQKVSDPTL